MTPARHGDGGFTLLEILVALVVLGFLLVALNQGTRFGLRAWDTETRLVNQRADMDGAERVLREIVTQADPGGAREPPTIVGGEHALQMLTRLPIAIGAPPTRDADVNLTVDGRRQLVLRWVAHPHAERLAGAPAAGEAVLLDGVDHLDLNYLGDAAAGWVATWNERIPPAMVRIRIAFAPGDPRHWPDIVTVPMRGRF